MKFVSWQSNGGAKGAVVASSSSGAIDYGVLCESLGAVDVDGVPLPSLIRSSSCLSEATDSSDVCDSLDEPESIVDDTTHCAASSKEPASPSPCRQRSIFSSYWSSTNAKNLSLNGGFDDKADKPVSNNRKEANDSMKHVVSSLAELPPQYPTPIPCVKLTPATAPSPTKGSQGSPRRKILPTLPAPPPPAAAPSSSPTESPTSVPINLAPRLPNDFPCPPLVTGPLSRKSDVHAQPRRWSSTSELIPKPNRSCLRKSRYSFSGVPSKESNAESDNGAKDSRPRCTQSLRGSEAKDIGSMRGVQEFAVASVAAGVSSRVSFHSQVSVFEFSVPDKHKSGTVSAGGKGWISFFT